MLALTFLAIGAALSAGCATGGSSPTVVNACRFLPIVEYPAEVRNRVADELEAAPSSAAWPTMITDYRALRDAVKRCAEASR